MILIKIFGCLLLSLAIIFNASAQSANKTVKQTSRQAKITPVAKFKPPVVKTFLGRNAVEAIVTDNEANQLINLPLKITDDKNNVYTISSYQFMYKKKSVIEKEETGKKEIAFTTVADRFTTTPLPKIWRENIGGGFQKDEELFFFDIIANDKLNRKFFAPNLKIRIQ